MFELFIVGMNMDMVGLFIKLFYHSVVIIIVTQTQIIIVVGISNYVRLNKFYENWKHFMVQKVV